MSEVLGFQGIFAPLPTPFDINGGIDYNQLHFNLERWTAEPLSGYVIGGSNGEFTSLSEKERVELVRFVREYADPGLPVIAGSGMPSTRATMELGLQMADAGAAALLVITPSYFKSKMTHPALVGYYNAVAESSPLPVVLYNMPANTGIDMSSQTILECAAHPRIVGLKDSSGRVDKLGAVANKAPEDFAVLAGSGGYLLGALVMGAMGAVAALGNIAAGPLRQIYDAFLAGDFQTAQMEQLRLIDLNTAITAGYGVAGLKAAMDMLGYYGGPVRPPLLDLEEGLREEIRRLLVEVGFV